MVYKDITGKGFETGNYKVKVSVRLRWRKEVNQHGWCNVTLEWACEYVSLWYSDIRFKVLSFSIEEI
nr:MAG TPA: hypothetical protein [Caudoviricetes sp.]